MFKARHLIGSYLPASALVSATMSTTMPMRLMIPTALLLLLFAAQTAIADSKCAALFETETGKVVVRTLQISNVTERKSLFELAADFNRDESLNRLKTPHSAFTLAAYDMLATFEGELTSLQAQISPWRRSHRAALKQAAQDLASTRSKLEMSSSQGSLTGKQVLAIAFDFVKAQATIFRLAHPELASLGGASLDEMTVIPTVRDHSIEDSLKLLSVGLQLLRLPSFKVRVAGELVSELRRIQFLAEAFEQDAPEHVSYSYLRTIIQHLEKMPEDRKRAGFAALYLAFFKYPERYLKTIPTTPPVPRFAAARLPSDIMALMTSMKSDFISEIKDRGEIAAVMKPRGFLHARSGEIDIIAETGLSALQDAMIKSAKTNP